MGWTTFLLVPVAIAVTLGVVTREGFTNEAVPEQMWAIVSEKLGTISLQQVRQASCATHTASRDCSRGHSPVRPSLRLSLLRLPLPLPEGAQFDSLSDA